MRSIAQQNSFGHRGRKNVKFSSNRLQRTRQSWLNITLARETVKVSDPYWPYPADIRHISRTHVLTKQNVEIDMFRVFAGLEISYSTALNSTWRPPLSRSSVSPCRCEPACVGVNILHFAGVLRVMRALFSASRGRIIFAGSQSNLNVTFR